MLQANRAELPKPSLLFSMQNLQRCRHHPLASLKGTLSRQRLTFLKTRSFPSIYFSGGQAGGRTDTFNKRRV